VKHYFRSFSRCFSHT